MPRPTRVLSACVLAGCAVLLLGAADPPPPAPLPGPVLLDLKGPRSDAPRGTPPRVAHREPQPAETEATPQADTAGKPQAEVGAKPQAEVGAKPQTEVKAELPGKVDSPTKPESSAPLAPLSAEAAALREPVRQVLAAYARAPFNTRDNTPANVLQVCLAWGCDGEVRRGANSGGPINAITCLCWNYPCAGYEMLRTVDGHVVPKIGYGFQEHPGQLLSALAMARVPREYPIRVGEKVQKIDDLIAYEQLTCQSGSELSFKLIGLAHYLPSGATWRDELGQEWSIERLVREELARSGDDAPDGGTHRLLALAYVVERRQKRGEPVDGVFKRAANYVEEFEKYALELQNPDGTWHPSFFSYRGQGGTAVDQIRSTGHVLRWLAFSLPEGRLQDPAIVRSVARVTQLLGDRGTSLANLPAADARQIAARLVACQALAIYDQRVFRPRDQVEAPTPGSSPQPAATPAEPAPTASRGPALR